MFLKRLETVGFKSFAERTTVEFVPGVTAVVGPNGSGKSNIIDAVRWVLGEQSARSLRGQKMEDIIFQGSDTRNPLNFAEVSLILNNEDNVLPIEFQEVNVTRRVYRSGESEFFINKQTCRLKDIVDLFMDTGLGRESFSIIGQGKIDEILSSKADERRAIFEEAAGVLKYKQRKNKAQFKLEETADNLDRVQDIVHEIDQQINPLRIQANRAKKFKEKRAILQNVEIALLVTEIEELHAKWKIILNEVEEDKLIEMRDKTAIQEREANVTKGRHYLQLLEQQITELQNDLLKATELLEQFEGKRNVFMERLKHREQNKQRLMEEQSAIEERVLEKKRSITLEDEQLTDITKTIVELKQQINALESKLYDGIDGIKEKIENFKSEYIEYLNERAALKNEQQSIENQLELIVQKKQHEKTSYKQFLEEKEKVIVKAQRLKEDVLKKTNNIKINEKKISELKSNLEKERKLYEQMQQKVYEGNERITKMTSRKEMLIEMKDSFQGFFYGVKEILRANRENRLANIEGAVVDLIRVPAIYITAIDTILGAQAQHVVVLDDTTARDVIQWLKEKNKGRATFLPLESIEARAIPPHIIDTIQRQEGYLGIAANVIETDEKYKKVAAHLMGNVVITDNLINATTIAKKMNRRFRVVTLEGDVVNPGGSMSGGAKKKTQQSLFTRDKELSMLATQLHEASSRRTAFLEKVNEQRIKITQLGNEITKAETKLQQMKSAFDVTQSAHNEITLQVRIAKDNVSIHHSNLDQLNEDERRLSNNKQSIVKKIETIQVKIMNIEEKLEKLTNEEQTFQTNEKKVEKQLHELQITVAEREERKKNHQMRKDTLQTQLRELSAENSEIVHEIKEIDEVKQSSQSESDLTEKIQDYKKHRQEKLIKLEQMRNERKEKQQHIEDEEKDIRGSYTTHESFIKKMQEREVKANRLDVALESRLSFLQTEYVTTFEKASNDYKKVTDVEAAKIEVKQIKDSIKALGTVNLGAIEEFERLTERHTFLTEQQTDLIEAKNTLYTVIKEMDKEMTDRFSTMFVQIQSAFQTVFKQLFGGGHAELMLTDPDDLLETGIDIVARPPGKKLRTLGLLSGGERALTAIALLFAILRARPVPFCILDEVDAALDEANVTRFGNYLKKYSEGSQFIVITHRKGTMEEADALYGVTMQESGVSRLVSVRLEQTEGLVEAT